MTLEEINKMSPAEIQTKLLLLITELVVPLKGDHLRTLALIAVADIWRDFMKTTNPEAFGAFQDLVKVVRDRFGLDHALQEAIGRAAGNSSGDFYS